MSNSPGSNTVHRLLTARQAEVLRAVAQDRVQRGIVLGTFEPHLLDDRDVIWTLRALVVKGLVQLQPIGRPRLSAKGYQYVGIAA